MTTTTRGFATIQQRNRVNQIADRLNEAALDYHIGIARQRRVGEVFREREGGASK